MTHPPGLEVDVAIFPRRQVGVIFQSIPEPLPPLLPGELSVGASELLRLDRVPHARTLSFLHHNDTTDLDDHLERTLDLDDPWELDLLGWPSRAG